MVTAAAISREKTVGASAAINRPRKIRNTNAPSSTSTPSRPNSSQKAAKMKSVVRSGMNSRCVCVPSMKPLPASPPEPIALMPRKM